MPDNARVVGIRRVLRDPTAQQRKASEAEGRLSCNALRFVLLLTVNGLSSGMVIAQTLLSATSGQKGFSVNGRDTHLMPYLTERHDLN